jgi:hypothetical protein
MAASRTGVSTLRQLCRAMARIVAKFPGVLTHPDVPAEIGLAVGALIAACLTSTFDDPGAGEITGQGVIP